MPCRAEQVRQLKAHLAEVHPAKPASKEQKLVYSGRLLNDDLQIRHIVRAFEPGVKQYMHLIVPNALVGARGKQSVRFGHSAPADTGESGMRRRRPQAATSPFRQGSGPAHAHAHTPPAAPAAAFTPLAAQHRQQAANPPAPTPTPPAAAPTPTYEQYYAAAMQLQQHAQRMQASGYPPHMTQQCMQQAQQYWAAACHVKNAPPPAPAEAPAPGAAEARGPSPSDGAPGAADPGPGAPPNNGLDANHRFAGAGVGAEPVFDDADRNVVPQGGGLVRQLLNQLMLIAKLGLFMAYFGAHAVGVRYTVLCVLVVGIFLWQGGWVRRPLRAGRPVEEDEPAPPARMPGMAPMPQRPRWTVPQPQTSRLGTRRRRRQPRTATRRCRSCRRPCRCPASLARSCTSSSPR